MDAIERSLQDLSDSLTKAWREHPCETCPLGEMAALARATLQFYLENTSAKRAQTEHWSAHWQRQRKAWKEFEP